MKHRAMRLFNGARLCIPVKVRYAADTALITVATGQWGAASNGIALAKKERKACPLFSGFW